MVHGAVDGLYAKKTLAKHDDLFRSWLLPLLQIRDLDEIRLILIQRTGLGSFFNNVLSLVACHIRACSCKQERHRASCN